MGKKAWQPELVLLFIAGLMGSFGLAGVATVLLQRSGIAAFASPTSFGNLLLGTLSLQGVSWLLIWGFLKLHQTDWREAFGWRTPRLGRILLGAAGLAVAVLILVWPLQYLSAKLLIALGHPPENERAVSMLLAAHSFWELTYFIFFAVVIAPVAEEFIFRGMLFPFLKQMGRPRLAWVGVSALFAAIHGDPAIFIPLFVLALVLTWLYEKTNCLLASVVTHGVFNAINLVFLLMIERSGNPFPGPQ